MKLDYNWIILFSLPPGEPWRCVYIQSKLFQLLILIKTYIIKYLRGKFSFWSFIFVFSASRWTLKMCTYLATGCESSIHPQVKLSSTRDSEQTIPATRSTEYGTACKQAIMCQNWAGSGMFTGLPDYIEMLKLGSCLWKSVCIPTWMDKK